MKKKLISTLLCVSMVAAMVAGCGSGDDTKDANNDASNTEGTADADADTDSDSTEVENTITGDPSADDAFVVWGLERRYQEYLRWTVCRAVPRPCKTYRIRKCRWI